MKNSDQLGRNGRRKRGGRGRRLKKNRRIGMGWHSGERRSRRIQRNDGVGGRQPGLRELRQAFSVGRKGPKGSGATVDPFIHPLKNISQGDPELALKTRSLIIF